LKTHADKMGIQGAVGELYSSSQHLRGVSAALQGAPADVQGISLPQKMLKMYVEVSGFPRLAGGNDENMS
jgi:hypothetical protein